MTGEVTPLRGHTILGRTMSDAAAPDMAAFERGLKVAGAPEGRAGVLSTIFSTRALGLTGELAPASQADYLSGLLIGHEIAALAALLRAQGQAPRIVLCGEPALCERYTLAMTHYGLGAPEQAQNATERGLWHLALAAGLVPHPRFPPRSPSMTHPGLQTAMAHCGLIAILRGITPADAAATARELHAAGFRLIEVPLNSPELFASIRAMRDALPADCLVGAGTVLDPADVARVKDAGGEIIVMPHSDPAVIRAAKAAGLASSPGVATPTEAWRHAGADVLKMFPAEQLGPVVLKAWRAVLRPPVALVPVGGITPDNLSTYAQAGASGFGLGSALYKPGQTAAETGQRARDFVAAWQRAYPAQETQA